MSFSSLFGLIMAVFVFGGAAFTAVSNPKMLLDTHAILIVIGGTFAASTLSFSLPRMFMLIKVVLFRVLRRSSESHDVLNEILDLAKGYRDNEGYLKSKVTSIKHPFLKEAIAVFVEGGIEAEDLDEILAKRTKVVFQRYEEDAENFKALSKFPPAFGLLGAVLGMISLMQNLGGPDSFQKVGPSMAIALVATLYGIAIANFFFLPLGENLSRIAKKDLVVRRMICDGVRFIRLKKHPYMVEQALITYMLPNERKQRKAG